VWKRSDPEWGERVVAWVVPTDLARPPGLDDLREWVAGQLPRWAAPRAVVVTDQLPRTGSGKVRRSSLL
jgi:acyl-CoA synthetase (AMP-forming)/AMP-acid ligase II